MGIFSRFKGTVSANASAELKKAKDSAKMVNEYLMDATEDFEESKKELDVLEAEESRYKRILDEANAGVQKYAGLAKRALAAGCEDDARIFIEKKQFIEGNIEAAQKAYEQARENADKMRKMHNKIAADIETLKGLKAQMEGTELGAEMQKEAGNAGAVLACPAKDTEKSGGNGGTSSIEDELKQLKSELEG